MNARIHDVVMKLGARAFPPPLQGSPRAGGLPRVPPSAPPWAKAPGAASRVKVFTIPRVLSRQTVAVLCLTLVVTGLAAPLEASARKGRRLYNQARRAELALDYDRALELYGQALNEHAGHQGYLLSVRRMQFVAAQAHVDRGQVFRAQGELEQALEEFQLALEIDPASSVAVQERQRALEVIEERERLREDPDAGSAEALGLSPLERARREREEKVGRLKGLPKLRPLSTEPINLNIPKEQDSKVVFETVAKLAGINVLFDSEYQDEKVSIELQNATLYQALDYVSLLAKAYWKPLTENAIFVTNDNSNKRRDYQEEVVQTFYLTNTATPQELQEVATAIRGLTDIRRVFAVPSMNAMILRGPADKIALAEKVINDIDKARPEVIIDVLVLETSKTRNRELGITPVSGGGDGISLPISFTGAGVGAGDGSLPLSDFGKLSSRDWSTVLPGGQLTALMSSSDTRLLQSPRIRAADNFQASLRIGDRIPIATGSFGSGIGSIGVGAIPLVNTQFTYTDVGVVLDLTPKIHNNSEISLHVEVEISTVRDFVDIGGISQPVIGQRRVTHDIRIKEGESSILGGLVQSQLFKTKSGVPFLGEIPILGRLFSSTDTQVSENEILVVLIPHIVRLPDIRAVNLQEVASGTEQIYRVRYGLEPNDKPALPPVGAVGTGDEPTQRAAAEPATPAGGVTPSPAAPTPAAPTQETTPTPTAPAAPAAPVQPTPTAPQAPATTTPPAPEPGAGARFRFDPAAPQLAAGEQVTVNVLLEGAKQIFGVPMRFGWDPKVLRLAEIQKGTFLQGDGQDLIFSRNIRNDVGQAAINISRFPGTGGTDGGGLLVTLVLEGVAGGSTTLRARATGARDATGQRVQVTAAELNVSVR